MSDNIIRKEELLSFTTDIVTAQLSTTPTDAASLPALIETVYKTLNTLGQEKAHMGERPQPAVPIRKSIQDDFIVCLEDGKRLKMLKRHL